MACFCFLPADTLSYHPLFLEGEFVKGDKVVLDFSEEFINNHKGGVELEKLTVYSIVNTLTELNEVNSVQFLINGKDDAKFKDNKLSLKEPFLRLK